MGKNFMGMCAYTLTIVGILFLLRDLGKWNFWNVQWWTVLFLMMGIFGLVGKGHEHCCCEDDMSKKKK